MMAPARNLCTSMCNSLLRMSKVSFMVSRAKRDWLPRRKARLRAWLRDQTARRLSFQLERLHGKEDKDLFEAFHARGRFYAKLLERNAWLDFGNRADWQVARKDAVHAASDHALSRIYIVIVGDVLHDHERLAGAANRPLEARIHEHRADAAFFIGEQQNLRSVFIRFDDFADDAVGRDDAHVATDAVALAAIEINGLAGVRTATDHTRADHGHVNVRLTKL